MRWPDCPAGTRALEAFALGLLAGEALGAYLFPMKMPMRTRPPNPPVTPFTLAVRPPLILSAARIGPPEHATTARSSQFHARLRVRRDLGSTGKKSRRETSRARASFSSIDTVGLRCPFSILVIVTKPTPARLASSLTL